MGARCGRPLLHDCLRVLRLGLSSSSVGSLEAQRAHESSTARVFGRRVFGLILFADWVCRFLGTHFSSWPAFFTRISKFKSIGAFGEMTGVGSNFWHLMDTPTTGGTERHGSIGHRGVGLSISVVLRRTRQSFNARSRAAQSQRSGPLGKRKKKRLWAWPCQAWCRGCWCDEQRSVAHQTPFVTPWIDFLVSVSRVFQASPARGAAGWRPRSVPESPVTTGQGGGTEARTAASGTTWSRPTQEGSTLSPVLPIP